MRRSALFFLLLSTQASCDRGSAPQATMQPGSSTESPASNNPFLRATGIAAAGPVFPTGSDFLVSIAASGSIALQGQASTTTDLTRIVRSWIARNPNLVAIIESDPAAAHAVLVSVITALNNAGATRLSIRSPMPPGGGPRPPVTLSFPPGTGITIGH